MKGVRERDGGIEIGALTTLTEVENDPLVRDKFALLAKAAGRKDWDGAAYAAYALARFVWSRGIRKYSAVGG